MLKKQEKTSNPVFFLIVVWGKLKVNVDEMVLIPIPKEREQTENEKLTVK
ncbi:hypothetical protein [Cohnella nanjingensis]|nr:hypothetical protein [Cohnella nanjingensis]